MNCARLQHRRQLALVLVVASWSPTLDAELKALDWSSGSLGTGYFQLRSSPYDAIIAVIDDISAAERDALLGALGHRRMLTSTLTNLLADFRASWPKEVKMEDIDSDEFLRKALAKIPAEERLRGLSPRQRMKGLSPRQRVMGLSAAELFLALPDATLKQLPEEFIKKQPVKIRREIRRRIGRH